MIKIKITGILGKLSSKNISNEDKKRLDKAYFELMKKLKEIG